MKALALLPLVLAGCSCSSSHPNHGDAGGDGGNGGQTFDQCGGDPASFARQAFLALDGRRPLSQAEVDVYVDLYKAAKDLGDDPKATVARAIMNRPEFADRWIDVAMDAMHVQRLDIQNEGGCWDQRAVSAVTPALATAVRDNPASSAATGQPFTMLDLAASAIALDDLSPIYRAQIFSLVSYPIPAANVPPVEAELARREDFGDRFDTAFLHRDVVCLQCHNSEHSVTDNDDETLDRHWPVPGTPEKAVYGVSTGVEIERAHAVFRVQDFVGGTATTPWHWDPSCGRFAAPSGIANDPAGIDAKLASISGLRPTVFDLEASLRRGFAALRTGAPTGPIADPDTALAWLVTLKVTEDVWKQATGTQLTIANYFPRNKASSDLLYKLASTFATSGYSLKTLLAAIVETDYFNRLPPEAQCGDSPYTYPNVFDPWVIADSDMAKRKNGPGDAVTVIDARTLVTATKAALEWPPPPVASRFPDYGEPGCETLTCAQLKQQCTFGSCCTSAHAACPTSGPPSPLPAVEVPFQRGVGMFLRNSERGFRGLDFQARLNWEDRYGACTKPAWVTQDFIDRLAAAGAADASATLGDVAAALKDRLIGEPAIAAGAEHDGIGALIGSLDGPASTANAASLRKLCGVLVESPQFLLQGVAGKGGDRPKLTPASAGYDAVCADLAAHGIGVAGRVVTCGPTVVLAAGRMQSPAVPLPIARAVAPRLGLPPAREPAPY